MLRFLVFLFLLTNVRAEKFNVLFIAVDDLRPDLGCYGVPHAKSPNIDRLAAGGVVFERAYCQQAVCSPSRASIMTGLRPDTTKVWDLVTHFRSALPNCITLPQHFKAHGYHCAAMGKIFHHGYEDGASWSVPHWYPSGESVTSDPLDWTKRSVTRHPGVESEYAKPFARKGGKPNAKGRLKNGPAFEISPKSDEALPDGATATEVIKRLPALKAKGEPFFLGLGFVKPHLPFVAPKKYWDLHDPNALPVPATGKLPTGSPEFAGHSSSELHAYPDVPEGNPIPADYAKQLRHGYAACISYLDAQVGRVLDALEKEGLADKTVVVLWGDHGWHLGDHGLWNKHTNFELAARAPLLIKMPAAKSAGRKCHATVEFVDVYPTLAELCGLPIPNGLAGQSLVRYLENPDAPATKPAISQFPRGGDGANGRMGYSVRNERWRATFWRNRGSDQIVATELYDLAETLEPTASVAADPAYQSLLADLAKHLPAKGADTPRPKSVEPVKPKAGGYDANEPRDQRFDRLYPNKTKLTLDEYLAGQGGDPAAAKARFEKLNKDGDAFVTRDEFIGPAKK
jgi:iduronate 2-sulfatase